ncbi:MAG TPA: glycoside hydrolase family 27 protein [Bryobacteraceae bacterium]|nr:glycoside hydrolase family 27 protein [Bryobacteraceae bacterium]
MLTVRKIVKVPLFALLLGITALAADVAGTWAFKIPGPDGTSRDTYFRLKQDGSRISGVVQQQFNNSTIENGTIQGNHLKFSTSYAGRGQTVTVTYEGDLAGDELHLKSSGGFGRGRGRGPSEIVAKKTSDSEGLPPARIEPPALHEVKYNGLAKTPPMGWNSWNHFRGQIDDAGVRGIADAMVSSGMKAAGYIYVNIDDTWQGFHDKDGRPTTNKRFPDMKALADYVHGKGLKIGIYSSPGPRTCANYEGSYGHEEQDAKQYAAWGFDYLKYDWCSASAIYKDEDMQRVYQKMGDALAASGRAIVFSLCQYGRDNVQEWGPKVGGNLWRTTGDIQDNWNSMSTIGFGQNDLAKWAAPGHWNDPDMLEIGNGGMTPVEYRTHMSLWSILAAPLLAGNDIRTMSAETKDILLNREVIAIDQDRAGHQGHRASQTGDTEVWVKPLSDGGIAVAMFNRGASEAQMKAAWADLGVRRAKKVRDQWAHKDLTGATEGYAAAVPPHGVVMLRVSK